MLIGGFWLKWWIQAAAAMSNLGLFEAEMSSDAFQLLGMSEIGMLPAIFCCKIKVWYSDMHSLLRNWGDFLIMDELSRNHRISQFPIFRRDASRVCGFHQIKNKEA